MSTSTVEPDQDVSVGYPLTVPDEPNGPAVRALLRRTGIGAAIIGGVAVVVSALSKRPGTRALAVGALSPGAGYVYTRSPLRFLATLIGFATSLVAWFGSGNIVLPPLLWVATAFSARKQASRGRKTWNGARVGGAAALLGSAAAGIRGPAPSLPRGTGPGPYAGSIPFSCAAHRSAAQSHGRQ